MHNAFVPETLEGWSLLHLMYRVKWDAVRALSDAQPEGMSPAVPELEDVYFSALIERNLKDNLE